MDLYSWRWMSQTNYQIDLSARCPVGDVTSWTWVVLQKPEAASWSHRHHLHHFLLVFALINNQSTDQPVDTFLIRVYIFQRWSGSRRYRLVLIVSSLLIGDTLEASEDKEIRKGINFRAGRFDHPLLSLSALSQRSLRSSRKMFWNADVNFSPTCVYAQWLSLSSAF